MKHLIPPSNFAAPPHLEVIRSFSLSECLDLIRDLQFRKTEENALNTDLIQTLENRLKELVVPHSLTAQA